MCFTHIIIFLNFHPDFFGGRKPAEPWCSSSPQRKERFQINSFRSKTQINDCKSREWARTRDWTCTNDPRPGNFSQRRKDFPRPQRSGSKDPKSKWGKSKNLLNFTVKVFQLSNLFWLLHFFLSQITVVSWGKSMKHIRDRTSPKEC